MPLAAPAPARLKARTEFSVTLEVPTAAQRSTTFRFEYREAASTTWDKAARVESKPGDTAIVLDDLNPTSTYEIRIFAVERDAQSGAELSVSPPSEVAAVDTDVPGCTPEPKCSVM
ncbi:hypothetical protein P43SY_009091 [Pythium insidiosum]|uniref:Fibronectin type-III domain-containing protein n=1 Tax=Pythium insidiosum TaxID=114742 RepID=A0AAD5QE62_PYTIN|nr:hypothetical protein P43SY_009091 [Pythium insidiosum]KAJ0411665.1 hypothetical protein ATCC90586_004134 [Pythium insidiosum]